MSMEIGMRSTYNFLGFFFSIVILFVLHVTFAVCTERNLDTRIPRYILEVS